MGRTQGSFDGRTDLLNPFASKGVRPAGPCYAYEVDWRELSSEFRMAYFPLFDFG